MSFAKVTVDPRLAEQLLRDAIAIAQDDSQAIPAVAWDLEIRSIIQGKHLTFRYILVTGLLGKATNPQINALALQAGADVKGAYDARSLCHGVVVPIERQLLNSLLGGSNEPFLNKPARFTLVSPSNAVRAGKDRELLIILHKVLSEVKSREQAFNSLCRAMRYTINRQAARSRLVPQSSESVDSHLKIIEFIDVLITRSIEGQVAAIVTGTVLSLYFDQFPGFEVIVHPVNQSGASSREVADIDIKRNGNIFLVFEVKDKQFSQQDVDHAAFKASQYGLNAMTFIMGTHSTCVGASLEQMANNTLLARNVNVIFIDLPSFVRSILALCPGLFFAPFVERLQDYAIAARAKDEVFEHMASVLQSIPIASHSPSDHPTGEG